MMDQLACRTSFHHHSNQLRFNHFQHLMQFDLRRHLLQRQHTSLAITLQSAEATPQPNMEILLAVLTSSDGNRRNSNQNYVVR